MPFRLVRRELPGAAEAFLVFATDHTPLAAACAHVGELPAVYAVRGGFLLVPRAVETKSIPGTLRLRRLSGDLYVPVDADLLPMLLPDEVVSLTRDRGLVVLPGGNVLAFDPTVTLPVNEWLKPRAVRRAEWLPFPPRPERPATLGLIERPSPPVIAVMEVLGEGAPDDARPLTGAGEGAGEAVPEDARPPAGSRLGRAAAGAGLAAAGFLAWLGKQFGAAGLARLGGDLARRALERVPRLSEKLLGAQEAALREVLRQLQAGDIEKALSRAPAAYADPDQPARVGTNAQLAHRDPRYSLRDLIGTGGGTAAAWLGGGDVWAELAREYRRLAAEAAAWGDNRRAAYLYGVLLRDLRSAANMLMLGGLFHDAARLFRDRLNDPRAAADAFERAGDHDEAVRLYDRLGEHERAGDLLRRRGEDERALGHYKLAAVQHSANGRFIAAGDLMRTKALCRTAAADWYRCGWKANGAEAVACAERLLDEQLVSGDRDAVSALLTEAETVLADRPHDAGRLFNYALKVSPGFLPSDAAADLSDRVRLLFAAHLRTAATIGEAGALAGELFRADPPWAPPVGRDAAFASQKRPRATLQDAAPRLRAVGVVNGPVTAVAVVRGTSDLVVAGANEVVCWRVAEGRFVPLPTLKGERVTALSASARGDVVYALTSGANGEWRLRCFVADRAGLFRATAQHTLETGNGEAPTIYLQSEAQFRDGTDQVTVATPVERYTFVGPHLRVEPPADSPFGKALESVRFVADAGNGRAWWWVSETMLSALASETNLRYWPAHWTPAGRVDWLTPAPTVLMIASVDTRGCVRWAEFDARDPEHARGRSAYASHAHGYAAVCFVSPDTLAAVTTTNEVQWLRVTTGERLSVSTSVNIGMPTGVCALAARPDSNEVIALLADGCAVRLRRP